MNLAFILSFNIIIDHVMIVEHDINVGRKEKVIPIELASKEKRQPAVSPTDSYKHALRYSPPSGSEAGISEAEQKMAMVFKQMESIESTDSGNLPEMANLFELLPKVDMRFMTNIQ